MIEPRREWAWENGASREPAGTARALYFSLSLSAWVMLILSTLVGEKSIAAGDAAPDNVYATYGVHNDTHGEDCRVPNCLYERKNGEPSNPLYPPYWTSHWVMYRVFNHYDKYPPPYDGKPPAPLREGTDYQVSWGVSYYDSTWTGSQGAGAMEEHYDKFCIPIFPFPNNYSCSFISLGDRAFFITYADRPSWMPPVCLFSPHNHPPERDFIKHLPYAGSDGARLNGLVNGYSFWINVDGKPFQTGASPDQTSHHGILFGYAFYATPTPDLVDKSVAPYPHPHSFYFSGVPYLSQVPLPNAPIVSQNYTDFAMLKPDPQKTWDKVLHMDTKGLPECQLFNPPSGASHSGKSLRPLKSVIPTWDTLGQARR